MGETKKEITGDQILKGESHSNINLLMFCLTGVILQAIEITLFGWLWKFYETVVLLPIGFIIVGFLIFCFVNLVNGPLISYYSSQKSELAKKWGKRFPWILFSILPCILFFFLLFNPPIIDNDYIKFAWFVIILCFLNISWNAAFFNYSMLHWDKFKSEVDKKKIRKINNTYLFFTFSIGTFFQSIILNNWNESMYAYSLIGVIGSIITLIVFIISIPGIREDKRTINRYIRDIEKKENTIEFFVKYVKNNTFKHKNYIITSICNIFDTAREYLLIASIPYFIIYVLKEPIMMFFYLIIPFFVGNIIASPIFQKLIVKYGDIELSKKMRVVCIFIYLPMWFVPNSIGASIVLFIGGFCLGGLSLSYRKIYTIVYDEIALVEKKRRTDIYITIQSGLSKIGLLIFTIIFGLVHFLTEFEPLYGKDQLYSAIIGIKILVIIVPAFLTLSSALIFWFGFSLTQDEMDEIVIKIKELNI